MNADASRLPGLVLAKTANLSSRSEDRRFNGVALISVRPWLIGFCDRRIRQGQGLLDKGGESACFHGSIQRKVLLRCQFQTSDTPTVVEQILPFTQFGNKAAAKPYTVSQTLS